MEKLIKMKSTIIVVVLLLILSTKKVDSRRSFLEESTSLRASRNRAANAISSALMVGYKWCETCILADCRCNFKEEECEHCVTDDQYNNYRDEAIKAGKIKSPKNKYELDNNDLKILANGPKEGEVLPPNSDLDSLDGNAADRRKRDILTKDLAIRATAEEEKQNRIEAETAASILYNSPSIKKAQENPLSEDSAKDASVKVDDKAQEAKDIATNEEDTVLNEKKREKEKAAGGGEKIDAPYEMPYDCTQDYDVMDEKTIMWCTGRHKDGTPIGLDGVTIV